MIDQALLLLTTLLALAVGPTTGEGQTALRWNEAVGVVEATGAESTATLTVVVDRGAGAGPILGRLERDGSTLRFRPRFPFVGGTPYVARLDRPSVRLAFTPKSPPDGPSTALVAIGPTSGIVPENLLKLYLEFDAPMSRGEAYRRVRLLDAAGKAVERPFLEIGEELWDPAQTRLTLLFDPGRIKRGLRPREEEGPILEAGRSYTLVVDRAWPDAAGRPLAAEVRKTIRAAPPDEVRPSPSTWTFDVPASGTAGPLTVRFPEPLDRAMLRRAIEVRAGGVAVAGRGEPAEGERAWRFTPAGPWPAGPVALRIDSELEDLAGNSIARAFEVDAIDDGSRRPSERYVTVPIPSGD